MSTALTLSFRRVYETPISARLRAFTNGFLFGKISKNKTKPKFGGEIDYLQKEFPYAFEQN